MKGVDWYYTTGPICSLSLWRCFYGAVPALLRRLVVVTFIVLVRLLRGLAVVVKVGWAFRVALTVELDLV